MPLCCSQSASGCKTQETRETQKEGGEDGVLTAPVQSFAPALEMELGGPPDGSGSPFEHM